MSSLDPERHNIALVVDDNPETLGMVSTALEENGITVLVARDGLTAIDLANRIRPDVILMDAVMPDPDGFETCRRLKSGPDATLAPIIFMTGLTEPEHIVKGLRSGGVDYITKPVMIEELLARITIHVMNAKMIRSAREALDTSGRSVMAFDGNGRPLWGSPKAQATLSALCDTGAPTLADNQQFRLWLRDCSALPASQIDLFSHGDLTIAFLGLASSREVLVKLNSGKAGSPARLLERAFSLTAREGEVLQWLSMGKTNRDIAQILSLSARTVNKHLEQVFQKMGVDNRTAAAVMADRVLNTE
ncbi:DNA-binding response regulator [Puniceibacterium sediminis]|uniref:Two component transcriptional regulator, LuxR family n=1 Tax=Puniceibacterium sediminis TaxID=1608407 RepID=A0A238ZJT9_9RHOB|nr:DNA-binding response regulator [Puniceibacterium sediminis]SNR83442.1 two component transcriptional regulator, LuxR family [Puniceibacterium sediminis]